MNLMKRKVKILVLSGLLTCFCAESYSQDYYGGGGGSWRRKPDNSQQQPKDKDNSAPEPSGYISINYGFATPEGSFAQPFSQGTYNEAVGIGYGNYGLPGSVLHFSLGIPIEHSNFGVALMFGSYNNQYDLNNYVNSLNGSNINYNAYSNSPIEVYNSAPAQNIYSESSIMGGLYATYPLGRRLSIDGRFMIGALLCSLPEQDVFAEDADGDALQYDVEQSNATSLAFDAGIGVRFLIAELGRRKLCAMVNVDYLYSNVSYNTQQDLYVIPATGTNAGYEVQLIPSPSVSGNLPIELLNVTFGIGYQL